MRLLIVFVLFLYSCGSSKVNRELIIRFPTLDEAKQLLSAEDEFTASWSKFDIDGRMQKENSTRQELLTFIASQVLEWTPGEMEKIKSVMSEIDNKISQKGFKLDYPPEILFIKTSGKEEGDASGYTRQNYIVIKDDFTSMPDSIMMHLFAHELFHVLSRQNNNFRQQMYNIIGFKIMEPVGYPETIKDLRLTNPDAIQTDSYIHLLKDSVKPPFMMVLYAKEKYKGGGFFDYVQIGFLQLKESDKQVDYINGQPVIYTLDEVDNFYENVGSNTEYIIHPEEIMADNFAFTIREKKHLPTRRIIEEISKVLKN
jgi:hypothetical protein